MGINPGGTVALLDRREGFSQVERWDDQPFVLLRSGDTAPTGGFFSQWGLLDALCLAADGRVVFEALGGERDEGYGLLCADAAGLGAMVLSGDPAPGGGHFISFEQCSIGGDGTLIFSADSQRQSRALSLYRATAQGISRLVGPGVTTADGATILNLLHLGDFGPRFEVNEHGTILVSAFTSAGLALLRQRTAGPPERVTFNVDAGGSVSHHRHRQRRDAAVPDGAERSSPAAAVLRAAV